MNICICEKDQDGQCEPCKAKLGQFYEGLVHMQKMFYEGIDRLKELHDPTAICSGCRAIYSDAVLSKFMGVILDVMPNRNLASQLYLYGVGMLRADGATATPHLDKTWREVCSKQGWDPEVG